jgi:hypothetical protein
MPRHNRQIKHIKAVFVNNCQSKRQYSNERQAREVAEYQMLINTGLELSIYLCDDCHKWHLTRQSKRIL